MVTTTKIKTKPKTAMAGLPADWDAPGNLIDTPDAEKPAAVVKALKKEGRITIIIEENDSTPPGGIFLAGDGRAFQIQAGVEVEVPEMVLHILDCAIMSVPVTDSGKRVIGYKDRLRFPYRPVYNHRAA